MVTFKHNILWSNHLHLVCNYYFVTRKKYHNPILSVKALRHVALNPVSNSCDILPPAELGQLRGHLPHDWLRAAFESQKLREKTRGTAGKHLGGGHLICSPSCFLFCASPPSLQLPVPLCVSHLWCPVLQNNAVRLHAKHTHVETHRRARLTLLKVHRHTRLSAAWGEKSGSLCLE